MEKNRYRVSLGLGIALAISLLCGFVIYRVMGFTYAIADDIIMRDIVSGAFTGMPDGRLIFVKYALGVCISQLFRINRSVDWYGFVIVGAMFLGLAAVLYRGLTTKRSILWKVIYVGITLGLFGIAFVRHVVWFQWTVSAAALGACALYLYATIPDKEPESRVVDRIFIWFMLLFTFSIREMVFYMVLPGFAIVFLCRFFRRKEEKNHFVWKELILPAVVFLSIGGVILVEKNVYAGEDWEIFYEFQDARVDVYDHTGVPSYIGNPLFFQELGLDDNEIVNLINYAYYLVEDLDAEMLEQLSVEAQRQNEVPQTSRDKLKSGIYLVIDSLKNKEFLPQSVPTILLLLAAFLLAFRYKRGELIPLIAFLGVEGGLWFYLGYMGRLPDRVVISMYFVMLLGIAASFYRLCLAVEEEPAFSRRRVVFVMMLVLCLTGAACQWLFVSKNATGQPTNYQLFKDFTKDETDKLYFIGTFMAEPLGGAVVTTCGDFRQTRCLTLGDWYSFSPLDDERLASLGISNIEETLLTDPNAYLVLRDVEERGFFEAYFVDKYPGCEIVYRDEIEIEERGYRFYQVQMDDR